MEVNEVLKKDKLNRWVYNMDELKELVLEKSKLCSGKVELQKLLGVHSHFLFDLEKRGVIFEYDFNPTSKYNVNKKFVYHDFNWMYDKFIREGLNQTEIAKECNSTKRVIEKWCQEKHKLTQKFRQEQKILNSIQKDLIIGSLIGDGHIDKRETQPLFVVSHAENQKDYLYWKYEILKDLCNKEPTYIKESVKKFGEKEYLSQPSYRLCTRIHDCLIPLRNMNKSDIINNLNEFSLSVFILDDGSRSKKRWEICVANFTPEERELFISVLNTKFNLTGKIVNYDNRYINFNSDSTKKLDEIILRNVPNNLDIIQYKILNKM